jgi:LAGLIDADG endonuclease
LSYFKLFIGNRGLLEKSGNIFVFKVRNLEDLKNMVIPFFDAYPLFTEKKDHYKLWKDVCVNFIFPVRQPGINKAMNKETLLKVIDLSYNMNKKGKRRKLSKEDYINSVVQKQYKNNLE